MMDVDLRAVRCVVFDFGFTLSSDLYFTLAPPGSPHWRDTIQRLVFDERPVVHAWMRGELRLPDIARIIAAEIDLPLPEIVATLERGCTQMRMNPVVWAFACAQRAEGRKTALVTANMDVFTTTVVPAHRLDAVFDGILNTADYGVLDKSILWDRAFAQLGDGIGYANSLLIEDGPTEPAMFRARGGIAYQYTDDERFQHWLAQQGWRSAQCT